MFKLMGKEINAILLAQTILIWTYEGILGCLIFAAALSPLLCTESKNQPGATTKAK